MIAIHPACISCNRSIRDGIYNSMFYPNLLTIFSAFIVLAFIVILLAGISARKHKRRASVSTGKLSRQPLFTAAVVLGIGTGGFMDGIVFHQLMQWHSMLSAKVPATDYIGKSINMFWDGIFHAFCLVVVFIELPCCGGFPKRRMQTVREVCWWAVCLLDGPYSTWPKGSPITS